jgi:hypothetical protein
MALTAARRQYMVLVLGDEEHGISVLRIKEILRYGEVTVVPETPPTLRGVIRLGMIPGRSRPAVISHSPERRTRVSPTV